MRSRDPDYALIAVALILLLLGLVVLYSASSVQGALLHGSPTHFVRHQLLRGVLPGIGFAVFFYALGMRWLKRLALPFLVISFAALAAVLFSDFGVTIHGATRWLRVGPFSFQPSEFFKLALIVYLAWFFARRQSRITSFRKVTLPFFVVLGVSGALLLPQPATGTFGIIALIAFVMFFFSGARAFDVGVVVVVAAAIFGILVFTSPHRFERVMTFLNPGLDPKGAGYQITQSLIAIGSGGFWGVGLGHSRQKYHFLPETIGDSIFAIFAEETGFVGATVLLALFLVLLYRGVRIALRVDDAFGRLLAIGISTWIVGQAFVNIGALTGLLPLTGIPLPFVSYGGSALTAVLGAMGILLRVSRHAK